VRALSARTATALSLPVYALLTARFDFVCDDAFISFRYAKHLAAGLGLRYNLGADPPVEGYSNFLWVLAMAAVEKVGGDPAVWSRGLGIACGVLLIACVTSLTARRVSDSSVAILAAALLTATFPPIAVWSTGGLDTMAFALAVFGAYERLLGDPDRPHGVQAGALALAASLVRADGAFWGALILGTAALTWLADRRPALLRAIAVAAAILIAGTAIYVTWRHAYHGDWLPNTARVKVAVSALTLTRGLYYAVSFALTVTSVGAIAVLFPWTLSGRARVVALQCAVLAAGTFGYVVLVGGDFMAMGRLLVPALPFCAVLGAALVARAAAAGGRARAYAVLAVLVGLSVLPAFNLHPVPRAIRERFAFRWDLPGYVSEYDRWRAMRGNANRWSLLGRALARHTVPGESIVLDAIGAAGYYSDLFVYDQYGLIDRGAVEREIAAGRRSAGHDRLVPAEYFLPRAPTYLGAHLAFAGSAAADAPAVEVPEGYRVETIPLDPADGFPGGTTLVLIARADR
jgi:arabinofuranosyltransferase